LNVFAAGDFESMSNGLLQGFTDADSTATTVVGLGGASGLGKTSTTTNVQATAGGTGLTEGNIHSGSSSASMQGVLYDAINGVGVSEGAVAGDVGSMANAVGEGTLAQVSNTGINTLTDNGVAPRARGFATSNTGGNDQFGALVEAFSGTTFPPAPDSDVTAVGFEASAGATGAAESTPTAAIGAAEATGQTDAGARGGRTKVFEDVTIDAGSGANAFGLEPSFAAGTLTGTSTGGNINAMGGTDSEGEYAIAGRADGRRRQLRFHGPDEWLCRGCRRIQHEHGCHHEQRRCRIFCPCGGRQCFR